MSAASAYKSDCAVPCHVLKQFTIYFGCFMVIWNIINGSQWLLKNSILNGSIPEGAKFSGFLRTSPLLRMAGLTFQTSEGGEKQHSFVFTLKFKTLSEKTSLSSQRLEEY